MSLTRILMSCNVIETLHLYLIFSFLSIVIKLLIFIAKHYTNLIKMTDLKDRGIYWFQNNLSIKSWRLALRRNHHGSKNKMRHCIRGHLGFEHNRCGNINIVLSQSSFSLSTPLPWLQSMSSPLPSSFISRGSLSDNNSCRHLSHLTRIFWSLRT